MDQDVQRTPNIGSDPINPAYYAGTACAEIIEHMPTNVGFAVKYAWRLGEKDSETQEAGKAIWYLQRELKRFSGARTGSWFIMHAARLINSACLHGKLDLIRSEIVGELVEFAVNREQKHLVRAITLFQTYTGENHEDNQSQ